MGGVPLSEIEIILPTIQYGNVKITATPEEWGLETIADAPDVGVWAATYLNLFQQGFKHGATLDVDAHLGAPEPPTTEQLYEDAEDAIKALDEGLGGVTEVDEYDSATEAKDGPEPAPWEKPAVDSKPKPWESKTQTKPSVKLDSDW